MEKDRPVEVYDNERNFGSQPVGGKPKPRVEEIEVKVALVVKMVDLKALAERIESGGHLDAGTPVRYQEAFDDGMRYAANLIRDEFE